MEEYKRAVKKGDKKRAGEMLKRAKEVLFQMVFGRRKAKEVEEFWKTKKYLLEQILKIFQLGGKFSCLIKKV